MKKLLILIVILICFLIGYGYWRSLHYGYAHIDLSFKSTNNSQNYILSNAKIYFLNSKEEGLAEGISDKDYSTINLIHPKAGDCRRFVSSEVNGEESRKLWKKCNDEHSMWIPTWIKEAQYVKVEHNKCTTQLIPIIVGEQNSSWQLWWVPLPHVGGKPYSYFSIYIDITDEDCIKY